MNHQELLAEIERLSAVCSKPIGEQETQRRTSFLTELERKFMWLTASQWRDVVTWVIDNHKTRALPTLEEFGRGVQALRSNGKIQGYRECEACNGVTLVYGRFRHVPTSELVDAMVPCPKCRQSSALQIKADLEMVDEPRTRKERLADALSPRASRFAIELAEKLGVTFDDTSALVLVRRSTESDVEPLVVVDRDLPENVDEAGDQMRQVMENKERDQAQFRPRRAPPKAEWVQPALDRQSKAAGEVA